MYVNIILCLTVQLILRDNQNTFLYLRIITRIESSNFHVSLLRTCHFWTWNYFHISFWIDWATYFAWADQSKWFPLIILAPDDCPILQFPQGFTLKKIFSTSSMSFIAPKPTYHPASKFRPVKICIGLFIPKNRRPIANIRFLILINIKIVIPNSIPERRIIWKMIYLLHSFSLFKP